MLSEISSSIQSNISRNFSFAENFFALILIRLPFCFLAIIFTIIIFLAVFIPNSNTGEFTRFLHRLAFLYFLFYFWLENSGVLLRFEYIPTKALLEIAQENSLFFNLFVFYTTIIVIIFFFGVVERFFLSKRGRLEFAILVFFLHLGGLFVLQLQTFRGILLALERIILASYVFVIFERQNRFSTYAGVQYFILGSLPSARLLLAFGLFYLQGGSLAIIDLDLVFNTVNVIDLFENNFVQNIYAYLINSGNNSIEDLGKTGGWYENFKSDSNYLLDFFSIDQIQSIINSINVVNSFTVRALFFRFFNFLFKLIAAPFHVWAPSVYGKAPIVSVTFLSIYSKARVLFLLFKLLNTFLYSFSIFILSFLLRSGILSIFIGRVGAFIEKRIKPFFVYSSMGHVGFRLVGLSLTILDGASSRFHYLAVYILSSFVRWFVLLIIGRNNIHLISFAELKNIDPFIALLFGFLVFSRSGIPPLGGFFIKLDVLAALLNSSHFFINYLLFFFIVASFFYYLRVVKILFFDQANSLDEISLPISFSKVYLNEIPRYIGRLWIRSILRVVLSVYLVIVRKALLSIQLEVLFSLF